MKIKKILNQIGAWLKRAVANTVDFAEDFAPQAVLITNEVKDFVEKHGDRLEELTKLTESTKDDEALAKVRAKLPEAAKLVVDAKGILDGTEDDAEILAKFAELIKGTKPDGRAAFYIDLAANLLIAVVGNKLPKWLAVTLTQVAFGRIFKKV